LIAYFNDVAVYWYAAIYSVQSVNILAAF